MEVNIRRTFLFAKYRNNWQFEMLKVLVLGDKTISDRHTKGYACLMVEKRNFSPRVKHRTGFLFLMGKNKVLLSILCYRNTKFSNFVSPWLICQCNMWIYLFSLHAVIRFVL